MAISPLKIDYTGLSPADAAAVNAAYIQGGGKASDIQDITLYGGTASDPSYSATKIVHQTPDGTGFQYGYGPATAAVGAPTGVQNVFPVYTQAGSNMVASAAASAPTSVSATNVGSSAFNLPNQTISDYSGVLEAIKAGMNPNQIYESITGKKVDSKVQQPGATDPNSLESLFKDYLGSQEAPPSTADIYAQESAAAGIRQKQQAVNDYTSQLGAIVAKSQADQLRVEGQGRGIPSVIIGGQQAQIAKEAAIQALPIAAQLAAAQGNLELAQSHLDTIFKIRSDDATNQYTYKNNIIKSVYDFATAAQKRKLDALDQEAQNNFTLSRDAISHQNDLSKAAMANGQPDLAAKIAALDTNSPMYQSDLAKLQSQFNVTKTDELQFVSGSANQPSGIFNKTTGTFTRTGGGGPSGNGGGGSMAGLTPEQQSDPFIKKLMASSGGKPMTDTSIQKIDKGLGVLGQLGLLQTNIKDTNTGPIMGLMRGANPWDTNAQTIKAQLNAIVPNLARGVYGEVGVLTDNDIKTYSQTLPNLTSTEAVRNAVLGITIDLVGKSIKRTLEVNAANGKDVSGFVDLYTEMNNTRDSIFSQIPGYTGPGAQVAVSPEKTDIFDSTVGGNSSNPIGGFFSDILKGFTGQ